MAPDVKNEETNPKNKKQYIKFDFKKTIRKGLNKKRPKTKCNKPFKF